MIEKLKPYLSYIEYALYSLFSIIIVYPNFKKLNLKSLIPAAGITAVAATPLLLGGKLVQSYVFLIQSALIIFSLSFQIYFTKKNFEDNDTNISFKIMSIIIIILVSIVIVIKNFYMDDRVNQKAGKICWDDFDTEIEKFRDSGNYKPSADACIKAAECVGLDKGAQVQLKQMIADKPSYESSNMCNIIKSGHPDPPPTV
jgi:hypothetical protein